MWYPFYFKKGNSGIRFPVYHPAALDWNLQKAHYVRRLFSQQSGRSWQKAIQDAQNAGFQFFFGAEQEFYLFNLDDNGKPTKEKPAMADASMAIPYSKARGSSSGMMDMFFCLPNTSQKAFPVLCYPHQMVFDIICAMGWFPVVFHFYHLKFSISVLHHPKLGEWGWPKGFALRRGF